MKTRPPRGRAFALALLLVSSGLVGAGCVGYLTGTYDSEMRRLNAIVAELEAKNAALAEECIGLRRRLRELERADRDLSHSEGGRATAARPVSSASAPADGGTGATMTGE